MLIQINFFSRYKTVICKIRENYFFSLLILLSVLLISYSKPFLVFPYDVWRDLIYIDIYYNGLDELYNHRHLWHYLWSQLFSIMSVENFFIRAKIIHVIQSLICFFSIFFFSKVILRNLFYKIENKFVNYLALWSVFIWFTIFATNSLHYQQVWILWYSINYQVSLPIFWYITALSISLLFEQNSRKHQLFYILQITLLSRFILQIHAMEMAYFLMHLFLILIIFSDKFYLFIKQHKRYLIQVSILILCMIWYVSNFVFKENIAFFNFLTLEKLPILFRQVFTDGQAIVAGLNRSTAAINELMFVALFLSISLITIIFINKTKMKIINVRWLSYLFISGLFITIPLIQFSAGLASQIFGIYVIHRVYYSSTLFILIPVTIYYFSILYLKSNRLIKINTIIALILISTLLYSYYLSSSKTYATNIKSLMDSFDDKKQGFNLSIKQINIIGRELKIYEKNNITEKTLKYFAREDIALILKFIYKKNVYWTRSKHLTKNKTFNWYGYGLNTGKLSQEDFYNTLKSTEQAVFFVTPSDFPSYIPYK